MKLIINYIPPTINKYIGRTNRWEYQEDKKECHRIIKEACKGIEPCYTSCKMKITYYFKDKIRRDPSNFDKMLLDGLVEAKIIKDDNYGVIKEFTTVGMVDKENPRTEVEIEEV
jgi:crossover junction endodeoxyribonuclease RusA